MADESARPNRSLTDTWLSFGSERRARRIGSCVVALAGVVNLVSGTTPPIAWRLRAMEVVVPMTVATTSNAMVAVVGLALLLLARGVRRGQRRAWLISLALVVLSAVLHTAKGLDLEEAVFSLTIAAYLVKFREEFRVQGCDINTRRAVAVLVGGTAAATFTGAIALKIARHQTPGMTWLRAVSAVSERLVGAHTIEIGGRIGAFLDPTMLAIGVSLLVFCGWFIFGPVVSKRYRSALAEQQVHKIVAAHGGDTLAYFALRDDKEYFFHGGSVVAYAVINGVALVSPDPIGNLHERAEVWQAFRAFADSHGWSVAVVGASEIWLPIYRESGMRDLYVGDVAVVDVQSFDLTPPRMRKARQAVNRIARHGYTIEFFDAANVPQVLEQELRSLMVESRRGEVERGFSMTLGRVFEKRDCGLLLSVAFDVNHRAVAFCQFVPAADINGFSLDLMRRSESPDHPNGLTDFVVVRTIEHLAANGYDGLALNFAAMRAVLAGETGDGIRDKVEYRVLKRLGENMQIESLWRYNSKFDPRWEPRFVVYETTEGLLSVGLAVAKAESFSELPLIGRFMRHDQSDGLMAGASDGVAVGQGLGE